MMNEWLLSVRTLTTAKAAHLEMNMIAEGYYAVKCIYEMMQQNEVAMPITNFAYQILYKNTSLKKEFEVLKRKLI